MRSRRAEDVLFWVLVVLSAVAVGFVALVIASAIPLVASSDDESTTARSARGTTTTTTSDAPMRRTPPRPAAAAVPPSATTAPAPAPAQAVVVVTASRGDSWLSARAGSASGKLLDERLLEQGDSARFEAPRVWLSLGAAGNVDVTVNGQPRSLGNGTVASVLAPAAGGSAR